MSQVDDSEAFTLSVAERVTIAYALAVAFVDQQSWAVRSTAYAEQFPAQAAAYRRSADEALVAMEKCRSAAEAVGLRAAFDGQVAALTSQATRRDVAAITAAVAS